VGAGEMDRAKKPLARHENMRLVASKCLCGEQKLKRDGQKRALKKEVSMPRG